MKIGQQATTFISFNKNYKELVKSTGRTLYILDEYNGLHSHDIKKLLEIKIFK